jgi:predicted O-methyltransferase YrrM
MVATTLWQMKDSSLHKLKVYLAFKPFSRLLELGSGKSTVIMAKYHTTTLEHDKKWLRRTKKLLSKTKLKTNLVYAPMVKKEKGYFYDYQLTGEYDFVLIDGPPESYGRGATFYEIYPYLAKDFEVWLDDRHRPSEKEYLIQWQKDFPIKVEHLDERIARICPL